MKRIPTFIASYGAFLILIGVLGFLSNPEKAKTALISGSLFGGMNLGLAWLARRGWGGALKTTVGLAVFLALVFIWRSSVSWMAYFGDQPEKLTAAVLITSMLIATVVLLALLSRAPVTPKKVGAR